MSIQSISSCSATSALQQLTATQKGVQAASTDTPNNPDSSTSISKLGQFFGKLDDLAKNDPEKFKEVTAQISDDLKTAASQSTGDQQQFLQKLSDNFGKASQTGDPSAIQPSQQGQQGQQVQHHHHHHGGGGGGMVEAYNAASQTSSSDTAALGAPLATDPATSTQLQLNSIFNSIFQEVAAA